jgi:hypothetical protein
MQTCPFSSVAMDPPQSESIEGNTADVESENLFLRAWNIGEGEM